MYKKIDWPKFSHGAARCFNCSGALDGAPVRSQALGIGGEWEQHCAHCDMRTFYDTPKPGNLDGDGANRESRLPRNGEQ